MAEAEGSTAVAETPETPEPVETTETPDQTAEVEKWKALARQNEKKAKENATAAKRLAEIEESNKTELEKANERAALAEQRANEVERDLARQRVAASKGLPPELAARLQGDDEAELAADADALLKALGPERKPAVPGGARGGVEVNDMNAMLRRAAGRA